MINLNITDHLNKKIMCLISFFQLNVWVFVKDSVKILYAVDC